MGIYDDAARKRINATVRRSEAQALIPSTQRQTAQRGRAITAFVRITGESLTEAGVYTGEEVLRTGPEAGPFTWELREGGRFFDSAFTAAPEYYEPSIFELNEAEGVADGTVVECTRRAYEITDSPSVYKRPGVWFFTIGGGVSTIPIIVGDKVIPDGGILGDPNTDFYCEMYGDGWKEVKTDDGMVSLIGLDPAAVVPFGTWLMATRRGKAQNPASLPTEDLIPYFEAKFTKIQTIPCRITAKTGSFPNTEYTTVEIDLAGVDIAPTVTYTEVREINAQDDVLIGTKVIMFSDGINRRFWAASFADTGIDTDRTYAGEHQEAARGSQPNFARGSHGNRFKLTMVVGEAYHDGSDQIWYEYRQDFTLMSNGTIRAASDEYRVAIDEPLPC